MCVPMIKSMSDKALINEYKFSRECYEKAKENGEIKYMEFWANDLEVIEKELAERGLLVEALDVK